LTYLTQITKSRGAATRLREFVSLVARELRMQPDEFDAELFLRTSKLSLDRPAGRRPTSTGQFLTS
jgi:hypothetical protein